MRLSTLSGDPSIKAGLIPALAQIGVRTEMDLIQSAHESSGAADALDDSLRKIFFRLPVDTCTLSDLHVLTQRAFARTAAQSVSAKALFEEEELRKTKVDVNGFSSGIPDLDDLVGGFGRAGVLEIAGDTGAGKTSLALHIVLRRLAQDPNASVLWIDTTGDSLSGPRLKDTLALAHADGPAVSTALDRLHLALAFDMQSIYAVLDSLQASLRTATEANRSLYIGMVVIDSITSLLSPGLSAVSSGGHASMANLMRQSRLISRQHTLPFLVLNGSALFSTNPGEGRKRPAVPNPLSAFASTTRKPALGPSFSFMTDGTLWLQRFDGPLKRREDLEEDEYWKAVDDVYGEESGAAEEKEGVVTIAELFRSRYARSRKWCAFRIDGHGVPIPYR